MIFWYVYATFVFFLTIVIYQNKLPLSLVWFLLFLTAAFRFDVGTDFMAYKDMYDGQVGAFERKEIGYKLFVDFFSFLGFNAQIFFIVFSFFTLFFIYKGYKYLSRNNSYILFLSTILFIPFFYFTSLNIVRQALAAAIFTYAVRFIIERRFFSYSFMIFISTLFHYASVVFLIVYFIRDIKFVGYAKLALILLLVFFIFFNPISLFVDSYVALRLPMYYYFDFAHYGDGVTGLGRLNAFFLIVLLLLSSSFFQFEDTNERIIFNLIVCFVFIKVISLEVSIFDRFSNHLKPVMVLFLVTFFINLSSKITFERSLRPSTVKTLFSAFLIYLSVSYCFLVIYIRGINVEQYNQYYLNFELSGSIDNVIEIYNGN